MSVRITLAMIVRNEAYFLPEFLNRHARWFDELVVVDTGSTDDTVELLGNAGAKILSVTWSGDFAAARNIGLRESTGDWIMVLDPDEFVDEENLLRLRTLVEPDPPVDAYWFYTRNYSNKGYAVGVQRRFNETDVQPFVGHAFESRKIRLFRRLEDLRFEGCVHEILPVAKLQAKRYRVLPSDIKIHHYTHFRPSDQRHNKGFRYLSIGLRKLADRVTVPARFELALAYLSVGRYDLAAHHFEEGVRTHGPLADELGRVIGREAAAEWQRYVLTCMLEREKWLAAREQLEGFERLQLARKVAGR